MGRNAGILLSHNPSAEPGHSFTSVSLLPRQHLGWFWWWMDAQTRTLPLLRFCIGTCVYVQTWTHKQNAAQPVKCYYRELLRTQTRTHTHIWVLLTAVKQMNLCMRLTALSACGRYTKCSLSLVSSPCSKTLSLHSQYMLSCSFVLKAKQTSLFFSACIFLPIQTRRKQKKKPQKGLQTHKDESRETSSTGFQTPSLFLRIDYRCHLMQFQPEFFSCATFSFVFPHRNEKMQVDEILIGTVLIYCALS